MTTQKSAENLPQQESSGMTIVTNPDGTESYEAHTPDSYDAHIVPAETAARKEREGNNFKHLDKHTEGSEQIDTAAGAVVDKEGLLDNFGIEPEMYYKRRGDIPSHASEVRQEKTHQEELHQEAIHVEAVRQEQLHHDEVRAEGIHQEEIRQEKLRQETQHQSEVQQEKIHQEKLYQEGVRQERLHQDQMRQEEIHQDEIRLDAIQQEKLRQDEILQEKARQEKLSQDKIRLDAIQQEKLRQDEILQEKARQEKLSQDKIRLAEIQKEKLRQDEIQQENLRQERSLHDGNGTLKMTKSPENRSEEKEMMSEQLGVGTFANYENTEHALGELKTTGFPLNRVSVVGRDIHDKVEITGVNRSDRLADVGNNLHTDENKSLGTAGDGAIAGGAVGSYAGLLVGLGLLAVPGFGPVLLTGAAATAIATALSGGLIGAAAGSLVGGLVGLGIPKDQAEIYDARINQGDYLVIIEGSTDDIELAAAIFHQHHIHQWHVYDLPNEVMRHEPVALIPERRL